MVTPNQAGHNIYSTEILPQVRHGEEKFHWPFSNKRKNIRIELSAVLQNNLNY